MGKLLAFKDCLESKEQVLSRIAAHGERCDDSRGDHTCSSICLLWQFVGDDDPMASPFSYIEKVHSIPESVGKLQEWIRQGLTDQKAAGWTQRLYEAIPEGADLSGVMFRFFHWALTDQAAVRRLAGDKTLRAIEVVAALYERKAQGEEVRVEEWWEASRVALDSWFGRTAKKGKGRCDFLSGQAAENAALVEYGKARGESVKFIIERESFAVETVLGVFPHKNRGKLWKERICQGAADALIRIVMDEA
jgi:hypothetical protein